MLERWYNITAGGLGKVQFEVRSTVCIQTLSFEIIYKVVKYSYYHLALHDVISRISSMISSLSVKTLLCIHHQMTNKFLRK